MPTAFACGGKSGGSQEPLRCHPLSASSTHVTCPCRIAANSPVSLTGNAGAIPATDAHRARQRDRGARLHPLQRSPLERLRLTPDLSVHVVQQLVRRLFKPHNAGASPAVDTNGPKVMVIELPVATPRPSFSAFVGSPRTNASQLVQGTVAAHTRVRDGSIPSAATTVGTFSSARGPPLDGYRSPP